MGTVNRTDFISTLSNTSVPLLDLGEPAECITNFSVRNASSLGGPPAQGLGMQIMTYVCVVCYLLICVLGLAGNGLVLYVVLRHAKMKTVTNLYIFNLALSDFLFLIILPFLASNIIIQYWPFGSLMCKLYFTLYAINLFGGVFNLLLMSADRYLAVCHPVRAVGYRTPRIALFVCITVWAASFLVMLPAILYATTSENPFLPDKEMCGIKWPDNPFIQADRAFIWYCFTLGFALPVSLISVFYLLVIVRLRTVGPQKKSKEKKKSHRRVTRLVLSVVAVYVMCWLPYWSLQVWMLFQAEPPPSNNTNTSCSAENTKFSGGDPTDEEGEDNSSMNALLYISHSFTILCYANSMLNPFLYAFLSENFRKSFAKAFRFAATTRLDSSRVETSVLPRTTAHSTAARERLEMTPFTGQPDGQQQWEGEPEEKNGSRHVWGEGGEEEEEGEDEDNYEDEEEKGRMLNSNGNENLGYLHNAVQL